MDRHEWGEMLGDSGTVEDDLRWTLFQAERCVADIERDLISAREDNGNVANINRGTKVTNFDRSKHPTLNSLLGRVFDAQHALAALWTRPIE